MEKEHSKILITIIKLFMILFIMSSIIVIVKSNDYIQLSRNQCTLLFDKILKLNAIKNNQDIENVNNIFKIEYKYSIDECSQTFTHKDCLDCVVFADTHLEVSMCNCSNATTFYNDIKKMF